VRTVVLVTGPQPGPVASRELAENVEAAGAWGIAFEDPAAGCASLSVHAVTDAADSLHVGAWMTPSSAVVAAEQLTTLDLLTGGRAFGLSTSAQRAQQIERIVLSGMAPAESGQITAVSIARGVTVPPPVQTLVPVLVLNDRTLSHPHHGESNGGWAVIARSVQELVALRARDALTDSIRQTRRTA
jgi:hypothetical protein